MHSAILWRIFAWAVLLAGASALGAEEYRVEPGAVLTFSPRADRAAPAKTVPLPPAFDGVEAFTVAAWIRPDRLPEVNFERQQAGVATVFSRNWNQEFRLGLAGNMRAQLLFADGGEGDIPFGEQARPGEWRHWAVSYSVSGGWMRMYCDGRRVNEVRHRVKPLRALAGVPLSLGRVDGWNAFDGAVADVTFFDHAVDADVIASLAKNPPRKVADERKAWRSARGLALGDAILAWHAVPALPDAPYAPWSRAAETVREAAITLAPGEYEPAAVAVRSYRDLRDVTFALSDFAAAGAAAALPAAVVDIKFVKGWFQAGTAWVDIGQMNDVRTWVPELLLNDLSLVMVDAQHQRQAVRYGDGVYRDILRPGSRPGDRWELRFPSAEHPIRDAATPQPFALRAGEAQVVFLTAHVPAGTPPGRYTATLTARERGMDAGALAVRLEVLPFALADPVTAYDTARPYTASIYYVNILDPDAGGDLNPMAKSREQYRAELADLRAHGILNPLCYQLQKWDLDLFREVLRMRREAGLVNRPLFSFPEANFGLGYRADPEALAEARAKTKRVLDIVEEELGHRDVYFYGRDEAMGENIAAQRPLWNAIVDAGGKVFTSDCSSRRETRALSGDVLGLVVMAHNTHPELASERHRNGGLIWSYGNPQGGVENPAVYRRNYGLRAWRDGYDGFATYCYYETFGHPWDDFDGVMRDHNLVYPTTDGVVGTLAWEGMREAVDDVRYASTLLLAIQEAETGSPPRRKRAAEARAFLFGMDPETVDLDRARRQMVDWILALTR